MTPKVLNYEKDWQRVKDEQLNFLLDGQDASQAIHVMMVGSKDPRESLLKTLVQQAARN